LLRHWRSNVLRDRHVQGCRGRCFCVGFSIGVPLGFDFRVPVGLHFIQSVRISFSKFIRIAVRLRFGLSEFLALRPNLGFVASKAPCFPIGLRIRLPERFSFPESERLGIRISERVSFRKPSHTSLHLHPISIRRHVVLGHDQHGVRGGE